MTDEDRMAGMLRELREMAELFQRDPAAGRRALQAAGIVDETGQLTPRYATDSKPIDEPTPREGMIIRP